MNKNNRSIRVEPKSDVQFKNSLFCNQENQKSKKKVVKPMSFSDILKDEVEKLNSGQVSNVRLLKKLDKK